MPRSALHTQAHMASQPRTPLSTCPLPGTLVIASVHLGDGHCRKLWEPVAGEQTLTPVGYFLMIIFIGGTELTFLLKIPPAFLEPGQGCGVEKQHQPFSYMSAGSRVGGARVATPTSGYPPDDDSIPEQALPVVREWKPVCSSSPVPPHHCHTHEFLSQPAPNSRRTHSASICFQGLYDLTHPETPGPT